MNELQRQAYLSAMGIDGYMPRWCLPCAPEPMACLMPLVLGASAILTGKQEADSLELPSTVLESGVSPALLDSLINSDIKSKSNSSIVNATTILQQLEEQRAPVVLPFSLSIWRPLSGLLIIDSRNTNLALPTELLLGNILRIYTGSTSFILDEEVMRWPMIENRFVSRTADDARNELQTWLAVENELRPINRLWLMGENAATYLLPKNTDWENSCWKNSTLENLSINALILPSLNCLLQQPQKKAKLWLCL